MQKILKTYLRRLTNLTSRNRSLLLLSFPQEQFFDLHSLNFLDSSPSFEIINQLIARKNQISLSDVIDPRFEKVNEISKKLRKIARTEQIIEEERGANDLYVGYPFVKGKFSDGTVLRCPLLFFPVTISQKKNKWILEKRDENISFNRSFLLAYSHFNQVKIEDDWLENSFEDFEKDSLVFRTQLYELLKNSPFEINFNQDLFTNQLIDFERLSKQDLDKTERDGELKLYPQAILGIFPQGGSFLVNDYEKMIEENGDGRTQNGERGTEKVNKKAENLENLFKNSPFSEASHRIHHSPLNEANSFLPFAIDSSQEEAIKMVKEGKSIVVQGPPGTGKSQLICNLVADFTARGKRVLVVCQKRVALDTVFGRLQSIGMTDFVGLVHDFKNDRKLLFEKLANQIEKVEEYKKKNQSLDAIFLERNFTQNSRRIDQICNELQTFKNALFDESDCGLSVKELYLTSNPNEPTIELGDLYKSFNFNELDNFERKLNQYFEYEKAINFDQNSFWKNRVSFDKFGFQDKKAIEKTVSEIIDFQKDLPSEINISELNNFDENIVLKFRQCFENHEIETIFDKIKNHKKYLENKAFDLNKILDEIETLFQNFGIEKTIEKEKLELRKIQIEKALEASKSYFSWLNWKLFSKDKKEVGKTIFENKLNLQTPDLELLKQKIENRISFELLIEKLSRKDIKISISDEFSKIKQSLKNYILANNANRIFEENIFLKKAYFFDENLQISLLKFQDKIIETKERTEIWKKYLCQTQFEEISKKGSDKNLIINQLNQNFDLMYEQDIIKESFSKIELTVLERLKINYDSSIHSFTHSVSTVALIHSFQNSLRLAWIEDIENKYPILRGVSSLKIKQLEEELQTCIKAKQALSQEIVSLKLREETYKDLTINRLQNTTTYRELLHQVSKKRKIWSVRKVIENYEDEIFKLIPCWMASPESVSAIFPLKNNNFDLIIFDEASQCYAENGIPAIFRGKQVVIAGDSKQLQPNDLYQIRYEEEVSDEPILEIDSLLDLATQYLPQTQLKGHYRSHSLDLIDFSNQYFYKNTLRLLPYFEEINQKQPAINYIKVDGFWENNSNEIEAKKVVEIASDLQKKYPSKSIGIVTFNFKQADLIENFFINHKSSISIKNIENIQGDEFDFVIFSVGYAPDLKGKLLMNFGSLNQKGGENRLNVAITRAKEQIFLVSSILPSQLRVEDSQNEGPKLLKKYLAFALEVSEGKYFPKPNPEEKYHADWLLKNQVLEIGERVKKGERGEIENQNNSISYLISEASVAKISYLKKELPFADITVKNQEKYESLILTDDDLYFENSVKESHAYLPINLEEKGWKFERIWSRNFRN